MEQPKAGADPAEVEALTSFPAATQAQQSGGGTQGCIKAAHGAGEAPVGAASLPDAESAPRTPAAAAAARPPSSLPSGSGASMACSRKPASTSSKGMRRLSDVMTPAVCLGMSLASAGIAGLLLAAPGQAARGLFRKHAIEPLDSQHSSLGRLDAGGVLADAGAMAALMLPADSWAQAGMGGRAPDLLKLGLAARGLADTVNSAFYSGAVAPLLILPFLAATASGFVMPAWDLLAAGRGRGLLGELRRRLAPPTRSLLGGAHYLLALLLPASGAALLTFWPQFANYHIFGYSYGASTSLMATLAGGAAAFTLPMMNLLLKDAASSCTLGSRAARVLNAGQLLASLPYLAVLLPILGGGGSSAGGGGWLLPIHIATWMFALATSAAGLLAGNPAPASTVAASAEGMSESQAGKDD